MSKALTRIHVEGFRSLEKIDLEPGRITVLIGPNGAGKSNLLHFLQMISRIRTRSLRLFVGSSGGASSLLFYGPKRTQEISFRLELTDPPVTDSYSVRLGLSAGDTLQFLDEETGRQGSPTAAPKALSLGVGHQESLLPDPASDPNGASQQAVAWWLSQIGFYHFHDTTVSSALRTNSRVEDSHRLRWDGNNLASYLAALRWSTATADQKAWRRINLFLRQVAPFVKELRPVAVGGSPQHGVGENGAPVAGQSVRLDWVDDQDEIFGPHHLSDGTLRAIALITVLAQPAANLPAFLCIDEPELGLHPAALGSLVGLIRSVSHRCQILLATQSSALLDLFSPDEVVVTELNKGRTELKRLDPEALSEWLERYTLSELYAKNILGGRP